MEAIALISAKQSGTPYVNLGAILRYLFRHAFKTLLTRTDESQVYFIPTSFLCRVLSYWLRQTVT
jgi:hypothetical protein